MATCYFLATETGQCPEFQVELILKVNHVRSSTEYSVKAGGSRLGKGCTSRELLKIFGINFHSFRNFGMNFHSFGIFGMDFHSFWNFS